jgi:hypothetical protein
MPRWPIFGPGAVPEAAITLAGAESILLRGGLLRLNRTIVPTTRARSLDGNLLLYRLPGWPWFGFIGQDWLSLFVTPLGIDRAIDASS